VLVCTLGHSWKGDTEWDSLRCVGFQTLLARSAEYLATGKVTLISTGKGRTTCGYFYDHDRRVLFASTHAGGDSCPPPPDMSHGYTWAIYPTYEIFTARPDGSDLKRLTNHPDYDAEGTMSVDGKWLVFTSKRDGDVDLYKMHMDGTGLTRLTRAPGNDAPIGGLKVVSTQGWVAARPSGTENVTKLYAERHLFRPSKSGRAPVAGARCRFHPRQPLVAGPLPRHKAIRTAGALPWCAERDHASGLPRAAASGKTVTASAAKPTWTVAPSPMTSPGPAS
jgi:hypothetical protein